MTSRVIPVPAEPMLEAVGDALRNVIPLPEHDAEERAERHELRKIELREAVKK